MPNHVSQAVTIKGDSGLIRYLHGAVKAETFCWSVVPMPLELVKTQGQKKGKEKLMPDWYTWRNNKWGTKWDIYHVSGVECDVEENPLESLRAAWDETPSTLSFKCDTAWSPPVPVWDELIRLGLSVEAIYLDEGMGFCGHYIDGQDNVYEDKQQMKNIADMLGIDNDFHMED